MRLAVVLVVLVACTTATASILNDLLVNSSSAAHATLQDVMEAILPRGPALAGSGRLSAMHGRETHVEEVCFDITSICFITNSFRANMACPKEKHQYGEDPVWQHSISDQLARKKSVGICEWALVSDNTNLPVSQNLFSWGPFVASCVLKEPNTCGLEGCENLWLSVQGIAYVSQVVTTVQPTKSNECPIQAKRRAATGEKAGDTRLQDRQQALQDDLAAYPTPQQRQGTGQGEFFVGDVFILSAPMTVASPTQEPRWEHGWFELVIPLGAFTSPATQQQLQTLPRIQPSELYNYKLQFFKSTGVY